jgi:hypothetical protein
MRGVSNENAISLVGRALFTRFLADRNLLPRNMSDVGTAASLFDKQIVGFDINESALRFAALGLYLMSIELDPEPKPVDKLGFENLLGRVLHKVNNEGQGEGVALDSLGPLVGDSHLGQYDLVIGNPCLPQNFLFYLITRGRRGFLRQSRTAHSSRRKRIATALLRTGF